MPAKTYQGTIYGITGPEFNNWKCTHIIVSVILGIYNQKNFIMERASKGLSELIEMKNQVLLWPTT